MNDQLNRLSFGSGNTSDRRFIPIALPGRDLEHAAIGMQRDLDDLGRPPTPWNWISAPLQQKL